MGTGKILTFYKIIRGIEKTMLYYFLLIKHGKNYKNHASDSEWKTQTLIYTFTFLSGVK